MGKLSTLAVLVTLLGCADFHAKIPFPPGRVLNSGQKLEIDDSGTTIILEYRAPESGDGEWDDFALLECYGPFTLVRNHSVDLNGTGQFYKCGLLFDYRVKGDNDGDPSNNSFAFGARVW